MVSQSNVEQHDEIQRLEFYSFEWWHVDWHTRLGHTQRHEIYDILMSSSKFMISSQKEKKPKIYI